MTIRSRSLATLGVGEQPTCGEEVRVEFSHFDITANLPSKVSLALFRVLQEAL